MEAARRVRRQDGTYKHGLKHKRCELASLKLIARQSFIRSNGGCFISSCVNTRAPNMNGLERTRV
jgi:hypothetical protein